MATIQAATDPERTVRALPAMLRFTVMIGEIRDDGGLECCTWVRIVGSRCAFGLRRLKAGLQGLH
jgi:hypothetical protein